MNDTHIAAVTFRDTKFEIPADMQDWDLDALYMIEQGQVVTGVQMILGDEQFDKLRALRPKVKVRELNSLLESLTSAAGVPAGKSSTPSGTGESTDSNS